MVEEEKSEKMEIDQFREIRLSMPLMDKSIKFDNLSDLINRMSSFDLSLFMRLLDIVLTDLRPTS